MFSATKHLLTPAATPGALTAPTVPANGTGTTGYTSGRTGQHVFTSYVPQLNDMVIFFANIQNILGFVTPSGWVNPLGGDTSLVTDSHEAACVYHLVTSGEVTAVQTTYQAINWCNSIPAGRVFALILRGADPAAPIDAFGTDFNSGDTTTPHVIAGLLSGDVTYTNDKVVGFVCSDGFGNYVGATPAGWTMQTQSNNSGSQTSGTLLTRDTNTTAGVAVAATNITPSAADEYIAITLGVKGV
jgi:hypothetical protein